MKHSFLDKYSYLNSIVHRIDPRIKLIASLLLLIGIVLTPANFWPAYLSFLCFILLLIFISHIPPLYILKRSLTIIPFVLLIALFIPFFKQGEVAGSYNLWVWQINISYSGLTVCLNVLVKAWLSILILILLSSSTRLEALLGGMSKLGVPKIFILTISFMYRYLFIIIDEAMRMKQARDSRSAGSSRLRELRSLGHIIGILFLRSYERAERVYQAMIARGFEGEVRSIDYWKKR